MEYSLSPPGSLKEKSLIVAAIALWTKSPVKNKVLRVLEYRSERDFDNRWKKIAKLVQETVKAFELPQALKTELSGISTQIGLEILEWAKYYGQYYCESAFFNNAYWTPQGAIDAEKTAKKLVNDESLSILKRYEIACIHCFEDMIPDLWKQWGKEERHLKRMRKSRMYDRLAIFWSYYIHGQAGEIIKDSSINEYGLNIAVEQGNGVAVRYFWEKLTPIEKERNLKKCIVAAAKESCHYVSGSRDFPNNCYTDIVCFLLNQASEERRSEILQARVSYHVLKGFLNFPYQHLFIPNAEYLFDRIQKNDSYFLLSSITEKIANNAEIYRKLFRYTWKRILDRQLPIDMQEVEAVLSKLRKIGDNAGERFILDGLSFNVPSLLKGLYPWKKKEFILSYEGSYIGYNLIRLDKCDELDFFIKNCIVDEDTAIALKEKERISYLLLENGLQEQAEKFTKFLDEFIASFEQELPVQTKEESNKRKVEDDNFSLKRTRTYSEMNHVDVSNVVRARQVC